jgi:hypothetical protein|tara:strand:- start:1336 stop:1755 length:420 start_codon:yes stop_codon:yes gene_type:complete
MATIAARKVTDLGLSSVMASCAIGGDDFTNTGLEFIRIQNTHASKTYTIKATAQTLNYKHPAYGNLTKPHVYITVAHPGSTGCNSAYLGPFKQGSFSNSNDKVQIFYKEGTLTTDTAFDAGTNISGAHLLKIEVLYLDN